MISSLCFILSNMFRKTTHFILIVVFVLTSLGMPLKADAQTLLDLPQPGSMVLLSAPYQPALIKGLTIHPDDPFQFDFIVDIGQDKLKGDILKAEGEKQIKYFLASLAIPEKDWWVNLSPYEKDKTAPEALSQTDLGRDLLAQDYILKQITASLIYPEKELGKVFWDKVYAKTREMYGNVNIPVNTFNKVWITSDQAEVFERGQTVIVTKSHLKVMLEEDYLASQKHAAGDAYSQTVSPSRHPSPRGVAGDEAIVPLTAQVKQSASQASAGNSSVTGPALASQVIREIILPELEKEVNEGRNFANLRQIYQALILASWYKKNLKEALLNQTYADKSTVTGIDLEDKTVKEQIYNRYLQAYKKGVFNFIKEERVNERSEPRKYFSGGMDAGMAANPTVIRQINDINGSLPSSDRLMRFNTGLSSEPADAAMIKEIKPVKVSVAKDAKNIALILEEWGKGQQRIFDLYDGPWSQLVKDAKAGEVEIYYARGDDGGIKGVLFALKEDSIKGIDVWHGMTVEALKGEHQGVGRGLAKAFFNNHQQHYIRGEPFFVPDQNKSVNEQRWFDFIRSQGGDISFGYFMIPPRISMSKPEVVKDRSASLAGQLITSVINPYFRELVPAETDRESIEELAGVVRAVGSSFLSRINLKGTDFDVYDLVKIMGLKREASSQDKLVAYLYLVMDSALTPEDRTAAYAFASYYQRQHPLSQNSNRDALWLTADFIKELIHLMGDKGGAGVKDKRVDEAMISTISKARRMIDNPKFNRSSVNVHEIDLIIKKAQEGFLFSFSVWQSALGDAVTFSDYKYTTKDPVLIWNAFLFMIRHYPKLASRMLEDLHRQMGVGKSVLGTGSASIWVEIDNTKINRIIESWMKGDIRALNFRLFKDRVSAAAKGDVVLYYAGDLGSPRALLIAFRDKRDPSKWSIDAIESMRADRKRLGQGVLKRFVVDHQGDELELLPLRTDDVQNGQEKWEDFLRDIGFRQSGWQFTRDPGPVHDAGDQAQVAASDLGGIDLQATPDNTAVQTDAVMGGVRMEVDQAMIERVKREGIQSLRPVIFSITPITDIWKAI